MKLLIEIIICGFLFLSSSLADDCDNFSELGFQLFGPPNPAVFVHLNDTEAIKNFVNRPKPSKQKSSGYKNKTVIQPTILFCYGFTETFNSESVQTVLRAYRERGNFSVFVIEWSRYNGGNFLLEASVNAHKVADLVTETLWRLHTSRIINLKHFHFVGNSLGAHIVGWIARNIQHKTYKRLTIRRITALDPAGPTFYDSLTMQTLQQPLTHTDANFVQVIHSDSVFWGAPTKIGHADFWPNGGSDQPTCPPFYWKNPLHDNNFCSHRYGWRFFAESIRAVNKKSFPALRCESWNQFKNGSCQTPDFVNYMGFHANPNLRGNFYLQTSSQHSYDRGQKGLKYDDNLCYVAKKKAKRVNKVVI